MALVEGGRRNERPYIYTGQDRVLIPGNVEHIVVAASVREIGALAFHSCERLSTIDLPAGLIRIGSQAFQKCLSLKKIVVPSTVEKIEESAFDSCTSLRTVELRSGIKAIGHSAFYKCDRLVDIRIPSSINHLEFSAFDRCSSLVDVALPEGIVELPFTLFKDCYSLTTVSLPSTILTLPDGIFMNCRSLAFIELPQGLRKIGSYPFASCNALATILIPSSVESIGDYAFFECRSLFSVEMHDGLREIGQMAFRVCGSLSSLAVPPTVVEYGEEFLCYCDSLEERFPSEEDLHQFLIERFDALPLHKLCYDQGHYSHALCMSKLNDIITSDDSIEQWTTAVDGVGMTPFHILAMSAKPNCLLFQELMTLYTTKDSILHQRDAYGCTLMDYLTLNPSPNADGLIRVVLQATLRKRWTALGLERWRADVSRSLESTDFTDVSLREQYIAAIESKLAMYERLETIALLEQALWKAALFDGSAGNSVTNRQACLVKCGADSVIPNVLSFLDRLDP
eukprot:scaffold747_cov120-Cylindrotheca_fusiformis.AAC.22